MYTEPDTLWWKENRMAGYEKLKENHFTDIEYIPTKNKGYRTNGERHPHSWSIVDTMDLSSLNQRMRLF